MPILRLCADDNGLFLYRSPTAALPVLCTAARGNGPIIIMIHGYKYDPSVTLRDPHTSIFAMRACANQTNGALWPQHLGFGIGNPKEGLAIAFGWRAKGTIWQAQQSARATAHCLERVIRTLNDVSPNRPIHIIAHSMGSEVVFETIKRLPADSVERVVILTGASYVSHAMGAMQSPAGMTCELFNVTSRENDLFDFVFERLVPPVSLTDHVMGLGVTLPNVANLQLDCDQTLSLLANFGAKISASESRVCHWSGYTRPGAMEFFAQIMRCPEKSPMTVMKALLPKDTDPRWSRFGIKVGSKPLLSPRRKTAS
ncbi:MAG: alpha/beta hydrolase [Paracoccaceae bacterium]